MALYSFNKFKLISKPAPIFSNHIKRTHPKWLSFRFWSHPDTNTVLPTFFHNWTPLPICRALHSILNKSKYFAKNRQKINPSTVPNRILIVFLFQKYKMENDAGEFVDLYCPRKWWVPRASHCDPWPSNGPHY